jgi:hypothetical protein
MINEHEILVLVFARMILAFLSEGCQSDRTRGERSAAKTANITLELLTAWHDIHVPTETVGQMRCVTYYSARLHKSDDETAWDPRRNPQILPQQFLNE